MQGFKKLARRVLLAIFLSGTVNICFGQFQEFLLLEKPGKGKRIRYYIGDEILFKRFENKFFEKGVIVQLTDSSFLINQYIDIPISEVEALANRSKVRGIRAISKSTLIFAVPAVLVISAADNIFNKDDAQVIGEDALIVASGMAAIAALGYLYNGKRYRLQNHWRLLAVRH